jgi:hypothetical protein
MFTVDWIILLQAELWKGMCVLSHTTLCLQVFTMFQILFSQGKSKEACLLSHEHHIYQCLQWTKSFSSSRSLKGHIESFTNPIFINVYSGLNLFSSGILKINLLIAWHSSFFCMFCFCLADYLANDTNKGKWHKCKRVIMLPGRHRYPSVGRRAYRHDSPPQVYADGCSRYTQRPTDGHRQQPGQNVL